MMALCQNTYQCLGLGPQTPLVCTVVGEMVGMAQCVGVCVWFIKGQKDIVHH